MSCRSVKLLEKQRRGYARSGVSGGGPMEPRKLEGKTVNTITTKKNLCKISIYGAKPGIIIQILRLLTADGITFDNAANLSGGAADTFSFTIPDKDFRRAADILYECKMERGAQFQAERDLALLCVNGPGIAYDSDIAAIYYDTLLRENVEIHLLSMSEMKISALVDGHAVDRAVSSLRVRFMEAGVYGPTERTVKSHEKKEDFHRLRGSGDYSLYHERDRLRLVQKNNRLSAGKPYKSDYSLRYDG